MKPWLRSLSVLSSLALAALLAGCGAVGTSDAADFGTASATPTPEADPFAEALDAAGWVKEKDFDWDAVADSDTDIPEVAEVLPGMTTWVREVIFNEHANHAASTTSLVNTLDKAIDTRDFDEFVDNYRGFEKEGLDDAAAIGLVMAPGISLYDEPRVAVSTVIRDAEDEVDAAAVDMTARAALPVTDGQIRRWGFYVYSLTFNVPDGYEADGTWWSDYEGSTWSPGIATCSWGDIFSADVADDGSYDLEEVAFVRDYAKPGDQFTADEFRTAMKGDDSGSEGADDVCGSDTE